MYNRSTASIFCVLLSSILIKIDMSVTGQHGSQFSYLPNSAQSPILLARVVHDSDDRSPSPPQENKT